MASRRVTKNKTEQTTKPRETTPPPDTDTPGNFTPEEAAGAVETGTGVEPEQVIPYLPSRNARPVLNTFENRSKSEDSTTRQRDFGKTTPNNAFVLYYGANLVDENNNISSRTDYTQDDVYAVWRDYRTPEERASFLNTLRSTGMYGDDSPSNQALSGNALMSEDERAIFRFLNAAQSVGKTAGAYLKVLKTGDASFVPKGSGGGVRVVSAEDAGRMYKQASLRILGRVPTAQEMEASIRYIQQQQRERAYSSQDAPSLQTAALTRAEQSAPDEATAQTVGNGLQRIMALLGGR